MVQPYESAIEIIRYLRLDVTCLGDAFTSDESDNYELVNNGVQLKNPELFLVNFTALDKLAKDGSVDLTITPREIYGTLEGHKLKLNVITKKILCEDMPKDLEEQVQEIANKYDWTIVHKLGEERKI